MLTLIHSLNVLVGIVTPSTARGVLLNCSSTQRPNLYRSAPYRIIQPACSVRSVLSLAIIPRRAWQPIRGPQVNGTEPVTRLRLQGVSAFTL